MVAGFVDTWQETADLIPSLRSLFGKRKGMIVGGAETNKNNIKPVLQKQMFVNLKSLQIMTVGPYIRCFSDLVFFSRSWCTKKNYLKPKTKQP